MGFTDVEPYAFDGLKSLQTLYLANNKLTSLDIRGPELEAPLPQLRFLHLQRNALTTTLGLGVFKALRKLYLDMNQVVRVEGLEACTGLQELYLDRQEGAQVRIFLNPFCLLPNCLFATELRRRYACLSQQLLMSTPHLTNETNRR